MFDIRKIQEQVIFKAIKEVSDDTTAREIVFGDKNQFLLEDNATWVKSTMKRLEKIFDYNSIKKVRINCQCGYGMDEKISFVKELVESSSTLEQFANHER